MALCAAVACIALTSCGGRQRAAEPRVAPATLAWVQRAEEYQRQRRYDLARAAYQRAKREAPDAVSRAHASWQLGLALEFWGEYANARRELRDATALRPEYAPAWHDLGMVCIKLHDYGGAERALRRAVQLRPRDPRPRIALAEMYWQMQRRYADALAEYRKLLSLELPKRVRKAVRWAVCELERQLASPRGAAEPLPFDDSACPMPRRASRPPAR